MKKSKCNICGKVLQFAYLPKHQLTKKCLSMNTNKIIDVISNCSREIQKPIKVDSQFVVKFD